jgi:hypothetical protein
MDDMQMWQADMQDQMAMQQMMQQEQLMQQQYMGQMMTAMTYDRYGVPKISKTNAVAMLEQELMNRGYRINKIYHLFVGDKPQLLRHCCEFSGVSQLPILNYQLPNGAVIQYYFCTSCGNLYIHYDFM